ncbi:CU044_2847 family protein [Streptomyces sp. NBC_00237]|uniref:CU044_2847 family protein n=1 Tax=Streptomyces sp. NBC_00237 TaxID=2975687 RepID=UPI002258102D|nr:CU044_2847 family protein [Streptomyces sp. NBC_00237]MCX5203409.1 CU044_2847 family protein [Streptomyces sp. NBC_00237]
MSELMQFKTEDGGHVVVEVDHRPPGATLVSRRDNLLDAGRNFEDALAGIRTAAESALRTFRGGSLMPEGVELEFGVKLTGEAGAVIAKSSIEGHITVKLAWGSKVLAAPPEATSTEATGGTVGGTVAATPSVPGPASPGAPGPSVR